MQKVVPVMYVLTQYHMGIQNHTNKCFNLDELVIQLQSYFYPKVRFYHTSSCMNRSVTFSFWILSQYWVFIIYTQGKNRGCCTIINKYLYLCVIHYFCLKHTFIIIFYCLVWDMINFANCLNTA